MKIFVDGWQRKEKMAIWRDVVGFTVWAERADSFLGTVILLGKIRLSDTSPPERAAGKDGRGLYVTTEWNGPPVTVPGESSGRWLVSMRLSINATMRNFGAL